MAITTVSGYQAAQNGAVITTIFKNGVTLGNAPWTSLWLATGSPGAGAIPTVAATCSNTTPGAVSFVYPASGILYITDMVFNGGGNFPGPAGLMAYARLSHMGGLSGTSLVSQLVNLTVPGGLGAFADLSNVEWYVEGYTQLGITSQTLTISYTNTSSVSGQTVTVTLPSSFKSGAMIRVVPTIAGDIIKSIDSCTLAGSTGTAGNFGFTNAICLAVDRAVIGYRTRKPTVFRLGLSAVLNNVCIAFACMDTFNGGASVLGNIALGVG